MTGQDVADLIALLEQNGLEVYVDGGWAVDAVLGEQTRPHDDLDIALPHAQVPQLRTLLTRRGFREEHRNDSWESNFVLVDEAGRRLDVHSYTLDSAGLNAGGGTVPQRAAHRPRSNRRTPGAVHLPRVAREVPHRL